MSDKTEAAPLALEERNTFAYLEGIISKGLATFREVGEALSEIRDRRLYRQSHDSFEAYLSDRWNLKRGRAYQLMDAAATVATLPDEMSTTVDTERKARALKKVAPAERKNVVAAAIRATDGKPTAQAIEQAARSTGLQFNRIEERAGQTVCVIGNGKPPPKLIKRTAQEATGKATAPAPDTSPAQAAQDARRAAKAAERAELERIDREMTLAWVAEIRNVNLTLADRFRAWWQMGFDGDTFTAAEQAEFRRMARAELREHL